MLDPFPFTAPLWLQSLTQPIAETFSWTTLPLHVHQVLFAIVLYQLVYSYIGPYLSTKLCPKTYPKLNRRTRVNWHIHCVSFVQSIIVNSYALYIIIYDKERKNQDWEERIWGYTGASGLLQGFATGYFIWDLVVTAVHVDISGWGMLAHAIAATTVFTVGFRPFINYYGPVFVLYELSSPFNNIHWFLDKLEMTGSTYQWVNGIALIVTFFSCRLVWGGINSFYVFSDIYRGMTHGRIGGIGESDFGLAGQLKQNATTALASNGWPQSGSEDMMRFAGTRQLPFWLAASYLASNIVLNCLNVYWMGKMIEVIRKRFDPPLGTKGVGEKKETEEKAESENSDGIQDVHENGRKTAEVEGRELRSRRKG